MQDSRIPSWLWLLAFGLVALNLRAPVVVIGPLLEPIMDTLGATAGTVSLLSTLIVVCFGLVSPLAPSLAARFGLDRALVLVLLLIAAGGLLRGIAELPLMLLGTLLIGSGIACSNVFMPSLIKRDRPGSIGAAMGTYTVVMGIGATLAAGTAIPILTYSGSWALPLWMWAALALGAGLVWALVSARRPADRAGVLDTRITRLFGNPLAWTLTLFMGLQSLGFYTLQTWMVKVVSDAGVPLALAGVMLSLTNLTSIPASYLASRLAGSRPRHGALAVGLTALTALAIMGIWLAPAAAPLLWAVVLGAGQGGSFALALSLIVLRTGNPEHAAMLSGMAQSLGYLLASTGPFVFGALQVLTGTWDVPLILLLLLQIPQAIAGYLLGRPRMIEPKEAIR